MDGSPLPRCNQETHFSAQSSARRARCPAEHVVNPNNVFRIIQNIDLQKETAYQRAVQVKPQHVSLKLRISEFNLQSTFLLFIQWSIVGVTPSEIGKSVTITDCHSICIIFVIHMKDQLGILNTVNVGDCHSNRCHCNRRSL